MKVLIFAGDCCANGTMAEQLGKEFVYRGHEVNMLPVDRVDCAATAPMTGWRPVRRKQASEILRSQVEKIVQSLNENPCDVIVATNFTCAEILNLLHKNSAVWIPFMVYAAIGDESLPRKARLSCDAYIVLDEALKKRMVKWKIPESLIHFAGADIQSVKQICAIIENESRQWEEIKRAFQVNM